MSRSRRPRYDKLVNHDALWAGTTVPRKLITIKKIDADSIPAAYVDKVKVSVLDNTGTSINVSYMCYAAYDSGTTLNTDRVIAHSAVSVAGNAYLDLGRKIWRTEEDNGTVGDPITIWMECSQVTESLTWYTTAHTLRARTENV